MKKKMTWWDFLSVADSQEARLYSLSTLFARFKDIHFVVNYFLPQKVKVLWKKKNNEVSCRFKRSEALFSIYSFCSFHKYSFRCELFLTSESRSKFLLFFCLVRNFVIFAFSEGKPNHSVLLLVTAPAYFSWRNRPNRQT